MTGLKDQWMRTEDYLVALFVWLIGRVKWRLPTNQTNKRLSKLKLVN